MNFAGLLLARSVEREADTAVRIALGAARGSLLRDALLPPLVLALAGTMVGLVAAMWATPALLALSPPAAEANSGTLRDLGFDTRLNLPVMACAAAGVLVLGLGSGLLPAWRALRGDPRQALSRQTRGAGGDRRAQRLLSLLVAGEIAIVFVLLVGTGLLARHFRDLTERPWGFATEQRLSFKVNLGPGYPDAVGRSRALAAMLRELRALPGVTATAAIGPHPLQGEQDAIGNNPEGAVAPEPRGYTFAYNHLVTPGYFAAAGQPLRQGREFTDADHAGAPFVCIVSEDYARRAWPGENPLGKRVKWGRYDNARRPWFTVVGVVPATRNASHDNYGANGTLYLPLEQFLSVALSNDEFTFVLHTPLAPLSLERAARTALMRVDAGLAAYDFVSLEDYAAQTRATDRFALLLVTIFGALGLLLAAVGIYGLLALQVARRRREFAIRVALGESGAALQRRMVRGGGGLLLIGLAAGGLASALALQLARRQWSALPAVDGAIFALAVAVLTATVLLASWLPARRASRADPLLTLNAE